MRSVQGRSGTLLSWRICICGVHAGRNVQDFSLRKDGIPRDKLRGRRSVLQRSCSIDN